MPKSAVDIFAILLLVLPGFLVYRFVEQRRADPAKRSTLWQLSEMIQYSVYVHLLGALLVLAVSWGVRLFNIPLHFEELLDGNPIEFLKDYFVEGLLLFTLYPLYVVIAAILMGAYDFPAQVESVILTIANRVRSVPDFYPNEPIWYLAFHDRTDGFTLARPRLLVRMKMGDIYFGELDSYPLVDDDKKEKDFLLRKTLYYPDGDFDNEYRLEDAGDGVGAVLLNAADVDSIQIYYEPVNDQNS